MHLLKVVQSGLQSIVGAIHRLLHGLPSGLYRGVWIFCNVVGGSSEWATKDDAVCDHASCCTLNMGIK